MVPRRSTVDAGTRVPNSVRTMIANIKRAVIMSSLRCYASDAAPRRRRAGIGSSMFWRTAARGVAGRPAPAERFVDTDQTDHRTGFAARLLVFSGIERALSVQYRQEVLQSAGIAVGCQVECTAIRGDCCA